MYTCSYVYSYCVLTAYCPEEATNILQGYYEWPETEAELTQTLKCNYNGVGSGGECDVVELVNATRYCNEDGEWEEPDVNNCLSRVTEMLCVIRNVSNAKVITDRYTHIHSSSTFSKHVSHIHVHTCVQLFGRRYTCVR